MSRNRDYILTHIKPHFFDYISRYWQGLTVPQITERLGGPGFTDALDALALAISEAIS